MNNHSYQICTRCVMDTTDPDISFDEKGICNHCHEYNKMKERLFTGGEVKKGGFMDLLRR